jgi:hypothetical protein
MAARAYKKPASFTLDIPTDVVRELLELQAPTAAKAWRPHTSLYIGKATMRELRRIAADLDRKPHDMLVEGIELVLKRYGRPSIAELEAGSKS